MPKQGLTDEERREARDAEARAMGLCCYLHAFNTADGTHPEWECNCPHCDKEGQR